MLKKLSIITLCSYSCIYSVSAEQTKYGYQLTPNESLTIDSSQQTVTADSDTKNLYGIYYSGSGKINLNANPLNLTVTNSNTSGVASGILISNLSATDKATVDLGDGSTIVVKANSSAGMNVKNTDLSASNLNIESTGKDSATGLTISKSDVNLTGTNKITVTGNVSKGIAISDSSTFKTDQIIINAPTTDVNRVHTGIEVTKNSTVDLGTGSEIHVGKGGTGISIYTGSATAKDLTITSISGYGVIIYDGSFAMNGGTITSTGRGITIGSVAGGTVTHNIDLTDVDIHSTDVALTTDHGPMNLNNVTAVSTNNSALNIGTDGIVTATNVALEGTSNVVNASTNSRVSFSGDTSIIATDPNSNAIRASYGGSIKTGANGSKMNIVGNLSTTQWGAGTIDLKMNSGSNFTGKSFIYDTNTGIINLDMTNSTWNMTDDSSTTDLALANSQVNFTKSTGYSTLTTNDLSGTGTFAMKTDIAAQQGDLIKVVNTTAGNHQLNITNQGTGTTNGTETLTVVETNDGGGKFALTNKVEAGGYLYGLRKADNDKDWELYGLPSDNGGGTQTSSALAGASFLNTSYLLNYVDNQTLLQRLGDLRLKGSDNAQDGFWMRSYGGKLSSFAGSSLSGFDMPYWGTQLGVDKAIELSSAKLVVGTMAGLTQAKPNYDDGDGNAKNYTLGFYATYYHDNGLYLDGLLKYNNIHNQFNVKDTAGKTIKGKGRTQGISGSIEAGKRFWLASNSSGFYVEPQAQLTVGMQGGDTVKATNGLKIKLDAYDTTLGRTSAIIGYQTNTANPINIYLKTGYVKEFSGNTSYKLNGNKEKHSFRGEWWDNGIGIATNINKVHNLYMDATFATGNKFDQQQLNVGYRYSF